MNCFECNGQGQGSKDWGTRNRVRREKDHDRAVPDEDFSYRFLTPGSPTSPHSQHNNGFIIEPIMRPLKARYVREDAVRNLCGAAAAFSAYHGG